MKKIYTFLFTLISIFCFSQTDQNISGTTARETEPFVAVNPVNPDNIIAAWMSISYPPRIVTKTSFDGGLTWGNINYLPHFSGSILNTSADPSITFNKTGTAFICYVDYKITLDSGYVRVAKSTNGGISWNAPVNAINALTQPDKPIDRPWIVCDKSNSAYSGRIYLVSKSYYAVTVPHKIWLSISSDDAASFTPIVRLDDPVAVGLLTNIMGTATVGSDGTFYCAYASWDLLHDPLPRFVCTKSIDGGNTFTQYSIAYPVTGSGITDSLYQGSYSLSANPVVAGNLIFQAVDARNGDPDILAVYSTNSGQNWNVTPFRVNDDAINNGIGQDMSWGEFTPNGVYALSWRDRRHGIPNDTSGYEIYTSISTDGGSSFKPNYCLSSAFSPFINIIRGNDFLGVGLNNTDLFAVWSDNRNKYPNKEDIYLRKVSLSTLGSIKNLASQNFLICVYPNPTNGAVNISSEKQEIRIIKLYNAEGDFIREYFKNDFSVSDLPAGIYYIIAETERSTFFNKLIKQ
jgi:hypothetical protein